MSDNLRPDDELDHDVTSMGNRDARPENHQGLGDQVTSGDAETTPPGEFRQLLDSGDFGEIVELETRYQVEQELGAGGQGTVLKAIDKRLGRTVALKFLLEKFGQSSQALGRFLTEAKAIARLNHHNIVQIFELERSARGPYIVMEYIEGGSLVDLLKGGPLELERAGDIICQVCDGLGAAHDQGIIHRDIKPANILMTTMGVPKLSDFGLARQATADHGQTQEGAVLGTIDFMSPEQQSDATSVDARSDLWSLAATFYQMLTGKSPRRMRLDQLPAEIRDVLDKALEENPEDRYQTAGEFKNAIWGAIAGPVESQTTDIAVGVSESKEVEKPGVPLRIQGLYRVLSILVVGGVVACLVVPKSVLATVPLIVICGLMLTGAVSNWASPLPLRQFASRTSLLGLSTLVLPIIGLPPMFSLRGNSADLFVVFLMVGYGVIYIPVAFSLWTKAVSPRG
jgi:hypothetical protein